MIQMFIHLYLLLMLYTLYIYTYILAIIIFTYITLTFIILTHITFALLFLHLSLHLLCLCAHLSLTPRVAGGRVITGRKVFVLKEKCVGEFWPDWQVFAPTCDDRIGVREGEWFEGGN